MTLLVLAFPALDPSHAQRIESARANRDDPSRSSIPVHFTLVFATDAIERHALVEHVQSEAREFKSFPFAAPSSDVIWDPVSKLWLLTLLPERGGDKITELHDALYSGPLAPELRTDIPYAPHVTVVGSKAKDDCLAAQAELLGNGAAIAGSIRGVDIVEYDGVRVTTVGRAELVGGTSHPS